MNRSAGSIMDNIAEGFERGGKKNLFNFSTSRKVQQANYDLRFIGQKIEILSIMMSLKSSLRTLRK
jgi:23S rRNA-intervening sequence protein